MCERYHQITQTRSINMMDYMSNFPPPTKSYAVDEIYNSIKCTSRRIYSRVSNEYLYYVVKTSYDEFYNNDKIGQGSLAGWHAFECSKIIELTFHNLEKFLKKKRLLKGVIKSLNLLNLIYKDVLDRHYAPGGTGMKLANEEFIRMQYML